MSPRRRLTTAAALAVLLGAPGAASGAELTEVPDAGAFALSDGGRWAVVPTGTGMTVIEAEPSARRTRAVDLATPCASQFGIPQAVGSGLVLVECSFDERGPKFLLHDLRARTTVVLPHGDRIRGPEGVFITGVGRRWVSFDQQLHQARTIPTRLDRRTGELVVEQRDRRLVHALDTPAGVRRLCPGIARPRRGELVFVARGRAAVRLTRSGTERRLHLERCTGGSTILSRSPAVRSATLSSTFVAWSGKRTVFLRPLTGGPVRRWRLPAGARASNLVLAGRQLVVSASRRTGSSVAVYRVAF